MAVGVAFGSVVGGLSFYMIDSHNYDIHFNRLMWAGICIGGSIVAGAAGGLLGGAISYLCDSIRTYPSWYAANYGPADTSSVDSLWFEQSFHSEDALSLTGSDLS